MSVGGIELLSNEGTELLSNGRTEMLSSIGTTVLFVSKLPFSVPFSVLVGGTFIVASSGQRSGSSVVVVIFFISSLFSQSSSSFVAGTLSWWPPKRVSRKFSLNVMLMFIAPSSSLKEAFPVGTTSGTW